MDAYSATKAELLDIVKKVGELPNILNGAPSEYAQRVMKTDEFNIGFCVAVAWFLESPVTPDPVVDQELIKKLYSTLTTILNNQKGKIDHEHKTKH